MLYVILELVTIVSFDPGYERTGYAVFENNADGELKLIDFGCFFTNKNEILQARILSVINFVEKLFAKYKPDHVALEQLIFNTNKKTAIAVAQTQGALLYLCAKKNFPITFISPPQLKQAVTGYGRADKKQVEKMVCLLLNIDKAPKPDDVVDAIACGLAFSSLYRTV